MYKRQLYDLILKDFWCVVDTNENLACIITLRDRYPSWLRYKELGAGAYDWVTDKSGVTDG